jgi:DNA-binding SARP family transcriptional activator
VHLAVNPDGATSDELMALLWPESRPRHSRGRFHTPISELATRSPEAVGADPIARTYERYHLDPRLVEVDLLAFNAAVDRAATTVEPAEHHTAFRRVDSLYSGAVAEGHSWLWLAPYREATRRHVVDAYVTLADGEQQPRLALALIQEAIRFEPYNEDLYQRAMRLHARLASQQPASARTHDDALSRCLSGGGWITRRGERYRGDRQFPSKWRIGSLTAQPWCA